MSAHDLTPPRRGTGVATFPALVAAVSLALAACGEGEETSAETESDTAAALAAPGGTEPSAGGAQGLDPATRQTMEELREISGRLTELQQQAAQDPEIQESQQRLQQRIEAAVKEIDPEADQKVARLEEIQADLQGVQGGGQAAMDSLRPVLLEAQQLQQSLEQTRGEAMEREGIVEALDEFREEMIARMVEIDPAADSLLAVAESLSAKLQEAQAGAMAPAPQGGSPDEAPQPQQP